MKLAFVTLAVACFVLAMGAQQAVTTTEEEAMGRIAQDWKDAYNRGDANEVGALYTEDGYYLSAHILAHGREAITAYWRRGILAGGHIDWIKPLTVFRDGNLGYTAGTYQATNAGVKVDGRILLVLKKVNGTWLIAAHETVVRDQP
jgi:ketosteroid isomerase-like protein